MVRKGNTLEGYEGFQKCKKHNYLKDIWTLIYKEKVSKNMNLTSYVLM